MKVRALLGAAALLVLLGACGTGDVEPGSDGSTGDRAGGREQAVESAAEQEHESELGLSADRSTCRAEAAPIEQPYGEGFPEDWSFPPQTTAFGYEDTGEAGTVVTAVSSAPFPEILDYLNRDAVAAGFEVTGGETEEHDAEATWSAETYQGRWAIRESATCPGETVIQVLAYPAR